MGSITFNNISTNSMGVVVQAPPVYEFPARNMSSASINGRNGDILIDKNSYKNVVREYSLAAALDTTEGAFVDKVREIVDWLSTVNGYARLTDTYEPEYFRLAAFRSGGAMPNFYDQATAIKIKFECKPQRFLISGEDPIVDNNYQEGRWINVPNPTKYIALPEITINGEDVNLKFSESNNGDIISEISIDGTLVNAIIDSELQDCYDETQYLNNNTETINGFPKLYPGDNWIFINEGISLSIKPRWWVL